MPGPRWNDTVMDGLALIEAMHDQDLEGGRAILNNADLRVVSAFLARLCCDFIESTCEDPIETAEALAHLRAWHAGS